MELSLLVATAVRQHRPELELLVREQVDAELARLVPELVEREVAARRHGTCLLRSQPLGSPDA